MISILNKIDPSCVVTAASLRSRLYDNYRDISKFPTLNNYTIYAIEKYYRDFISEATYSKVLWSRTVADIMIFKIDFRYDPVHRKCTDTLYLTMRIPTT